VAPTRSRSRGREHARPSSAGAAAEHATKIYTIVVVGIIVITAFLALTSVGHVIDAATQHFMLYYAGVFALIGLCASVGLGLVATDRMFLNPGHRVFIQSAHRAASFGAVTFLIIHIITEILAQRVHVLDAVIPFLSPFRTFYIGLGTIASDLVILLVITGIMRGRFNAGGKAWRWRAIHYTSYASFVFGVWHGLLAGRSGKPYVDWSYGFLVAFVLLGLAVRVFSDSLRPKENLSGPPVKESASSASAPMRAMAMFAQLAASRGNSQGATAVSGGQPVLSAPVLTALPAASPAGTGRAYYEPGYEGPPRYLGAPRATGTGPMPRAGTGSMPRVPTGPMPRANTGQLQPYASGPMPRVPTGPMPVANTGQLPPYASGPMPRVPTGPMPVANTGQLPPYASGPMPRVPTGPMPVAGMGMVPPSTISGPLPVAPYANGQLPPYASGQLPPYANGQLPPYANGQLPPYANGQLPPYANGQLPPYANGQLPPYANGQLPPYANGQLPPYASGQPPHYANGQLPPYASGPMPVADTSPLPPYPTGPMPHVPSGPGTGPRPQFGPATGPLPQAGAGRPAAWDAGMQRSQPGGPGPRAADDPRRRGGTGARNGQRPRPPAGQMPQAGRMMPPARADGSGGWPGGPGWQPAGYDGSRHPAEPPWDDLQQTDPNLRYREPGPGMPGYRGSREHRYGGDMR
jgi:hypothetical protein